MFCGFSIGTAFAPDLASFLVFRALTATQGTAFLILGSAGICDIYEPVSHIENLLTTTINLILALPYRRSEPLPLRGFFRAP